MSINERSFMHEGMRLIDILTTKIEQDTLILPTLPAIALQISDEASSPDATLKNMHDIIIRDAALSARIVKVANTAHIGRTQPVSSLSKAINLLGLKNIKNISMGVAMEQMFESDSPFMKSKMKKSWNKNVIIVGATMGVFNTLSEDLKKVFCTDELMLAALIHNIGCLPIYKEASSFGDVCFVANFMDDALSSFSGLIGGKILQKWGFEQALIDVARSVNDFSYFTDEISYIDLIRLGMVACEKETESKSLILENAKQKKLLKSVADFISDDYMEAKDNALAIFN